MTMQNGNTEIVDGDVVDEGESASVAIVPASPGPALAVTPTVTAEELVERLNVIKNAADNAMTEGVDYGKVPGTDKPTLFKPGAEKLSVLFQLDVQLRNEKIWDGRHLTVISHATVFHAPTGSRLGYGEGICSTRERKYAYRTAKRACPECGAEQINRSKFPPRDNPDADPGWYCYAKVGGCGANFAADDQRIVGQTAGEIENPDLPDLWNTVVKMGEKRARVDSVLAVTGASAIFTQDIEDQGGNEPAGTETQQQPANGQREAPRTTAQPAQRSQPAATAAQKRKINAVCGEAGLTDEQRRAILQWVGGTYQLDRLAKQLASKLIAALDKQDGAAEILNEITTAAEEGNERATAIARMYFQEAAS